MSTESGGEVVQIAIGPIQGGADTVTAYRALKKVMPAASEHQLQGFIARRIKVPGPLPLAKGVEVVSFLRDAGFDAEAILVASEGERAREAGASAKDIVGAQGRAERVGFQVSHKEDRTPSRTPSAWILRILLWGVVLPALLLLGYLAYLEVAPYYDGLKIMLGAARPQDEALLLSFLFGMPLAGIALMQAGRRKWIFYDSGKDLAASSLAYVAAIVANVVAVGADAKVAVPAAFCVFLLLNVLVSIGHNGVIGGILTGITKTVFSLLVICSVFQVFSEVKSNRSAGRLLIVGAVAALFWGLVVGLINGRAVRARRVAQKYGRLEAEGDIRECLESGVSQAEVVAAIERKLQRGVKSEGKSL